jgi:hypothetical protein
MHSHFDWQSTAEEACIDALGLVRDLLSPGMRLVETSAGGRPYRWDLEVFDDGRWRLEESCGLLLYKLLWPTQYPGAPEHPPAVAIRCLAWNCCCPRRRRGQL